jgi:hypothetical protein
MDLAYVAVEGDKYIVVLGNKRSRQFDHPGVPRISPDASRVAYSVRHGGHEFVVVGEEQGPAFDKVWEPTFSPEWHQSSVPCPVGGKNLVVIGDQQIETKPFYDAIVFSNDGNKTAYWAYGNDRGGR